MKQASKVVAPIRSFERNELVVSSFQKPHAWFGWQASKEVQFLFKPPEKEKV